MFRLQRTQLILSLLLSLLVVLVVLFVAYPQTLTWAATNLVAQWKFDDGKDSTEESVVGAANSDLVGNSMWVEDRFGNANGAISLDGSGDYVKTAVQQNASNKQYTVMAWVKINQVNNEGRPPVIVENRGSLTLGIGRDTASKKSANHWGVANTPFFINDLDNASCGVSADTGNEINDNKWHHIVGVWQADDTNTVVSSSQFSIYIDGKKVPTINVSLFCHNTKVPFAPGATQNANIGYHRVWTNELSGAYYSGLVDDVRFYDKALTGEEILAVFQENSLSGDVDIRQKDDLTDGIIGAIYPFQATVPYSFSGRALTYQWQVDGHADVQHIVNDDVVNIQSYGWNTTGTKMFTVTVTDQASNVLSNTYTFNVLPVPAPTIEGAANGNASITYEFTTTVDSQLTLPLTYTWHINGNTVKSSTHYQSYDVQEFQWNAPGKYTMVVSVANNFLQTPITATHDITITAVAPADDDIIWGDSIAVYSDTKTYTTTAAPINVARPITYTWQYTTPNNIPREIHHKKTTNIFSDTVDATWDMPLLDKTRPVVHDVVVRIWNEWGSITRTKPVTLTYRPHMAGPTPTLPFISTLTFDEDEPDDILRKVSFTIVDTDTVGTMNLSAEGTNDTGALYLPDENLVLQEPYTTSGYSRTSIIVTPPANRWGESDVVITVDDGLVDSSKTIHVTVNQVNDDPSWTKGDTILIDEDAGAQVVAAWADDITPGPFEQSIQMAEFALTNSNPELFTIQPTIVMSGSNATTGTLVFQAKPNVNGTILVTATLRDKDRTTNEYLTDGDTQQFSIVIAPINDAPIAASDVVTTTENHARAFSTTLLLANDTDVDLTVHEVDPGEYLRITGFTQPLSGTLIRDGDTLVYSPTLSFFGHDYFTYTIRDAAGETAVATVTMVVQPLFARDDGVQTLEDTDLTNIGATLLSNDRDPAHSTITKVDIQSSEGGFILNNADGITYQPPEDYNGVDQFNYTVANDVFTETATVSVTVLPVNDAPSFTVSDQPLSVRNGTTEIAEETWITNITVGPDNEVAQTFVFSITAISNSALFAADGTPTIDSLGTLRFTPAGYDATGTSDVTVVMHDSGGRANGGMDDSAAQTFTIELHANQAPVAVNDTTFTTKENTPLNIETSAVLANDNDPDDDTLTITAVDATTQQGGTVSWSAGATTITYTPAHSFVGEDRFSYTIADGDIANGGTRTAQADIVVNVTRGETKVYVPIVACPGIVDLAVSMSLSPDKTSYSAKEQVLITVVVNNIGDEITNPFWVDLFINPSHTPNSPATWDQLYTDIFAGVGWFVDSGLKPRANVTLTDVPSSAYYQPNYSFKDKQYTPWDGMLPAGTTQLCIYADTWRSDETGLPGNETNGMVVEITEANNVVCRDVTVSEATQAIVQFTTNGNNRQ